MLVEATKIDILSQNAKDFQICVQIAIVVRSYQP